MRVCYCCCFAQDRQADKRAPSRSFFFGHPRTRPMAIPPLTCRAKTLHLGQRAQLVRHLFGCPFWGDVCFANIARLDANARVFVVCLFVCLFVCLYVCMFVFVVSPCPISAGIFFVGFCLLTLLPQALLFFTKIRLFCGSSFFENSACLLKTIRFIVAHRCRRTFIFLV